MVEEGGVICDGDGLLDKSRGCDDELDGRSVIVVSLRNVRLGLRLRPLLIFGRERWRVNMLIDCSVVMRRYMFNLFLCWRISH